MVIVLDAQVAETPAGKPFTPEEFPLKDIPVAPVVVIVIAEDKAVLIHNVGVDDAPPAVLAGVTVIVPVALIDPQPPVNGMV